ncbi:MAG TPA: hypothetical protein VFX59_16175 [Polyangiales bacterium]|nr:hypothetical protein [Polyangiales bacterium]
MKTLLAALTLLLCAAQARAESPSPQPEKVQLAILAGLLQPTVLHGFNAALDVRYRRFAFNYSHGAALDYSANPRFTLSDRDRRAGLQLHSPWSTGFGVGVTIVDHLYVLADFKVHRYEAELAGQEKRYTTISIGGELGYRWFVYEGLFVNPTVRYWPTVWKSHDSVRVGDHKHEAKDLGLFANVSLGYAFDP